MTTSILDVLEIEAQPSELTPQLKKMILVMVAIGEPVEQVARKFQLSEELVNSVVSSQEGVNEILRVQTALFPDPAVRIKKVAHLAIDQLFKLLVGAKNETVRAKVAMDMLDRGVGKAVQVIENRNVDTSNMDLMAADRALRAQEERLARLEAVRNRLLTANAS